TWNAGIQRSTHQQLVRDVPGLQVRGLDVGEAPQAAEVEVGHPLTVPAARAYPSPVPVLRPPLDPPLHARSQWLPPVRDPDGNRCDLDERGSCGHGNRCDLDERWGGVRSDGGP